MPTPGGCITPALSAGALRSIEEAVQVAARWKEDVVPFPSRYGSTPTDEGVGREGSSGVHQGACCMGTEPGGHFGFGSTGPPITLATPNNALGPRRVTIRSYKTGGVTTMASTGQRVVRFIELSSLHRFNPNQAPTPAGFCNVATECVV